MRWILMILCLIWFDCSGLKKSQGQRLYLEGETDDYYVRVWIYFQHSLDGCRLVVINLQEKEKLHWRVWHISEITAYDFNCDDIIDKVEIRNPEDVIKYWRYKDLIDSYIINAYYSLIGQKIKEI